MNSKSDGSLSHVDIQRGFDCVAGNAIKKAAEEYVKLLKSGKAKDVAMEGCSSSRFVAAKLHTMGSMFRMYREAVEEMPVTDESKVLKTVCTLYGLWQMEELQGAFLKCKLDSPRFLRNRADLSRWLPQRITARQGIRTGGRPMPRDPSIRRTPHRRLCPL